MPAPALGGMLACPRCHTPLVLPEAPVPPVCSNCGGHYAWDSGVPDLTPVPPPPGLVADRWALWEQLQENGAAAYAAEPANNLSVGDRSDARRFGEFARLSGRVLDVGCGPQARPSYVPETSAVQLFGIDPLRGVAEREFAFVRGLAEYLPFADGVFDRVLFATSLDHLLDPERALQESLRVLAPDGRVIVWCGLLPAERFRRSVNAVMGSLVGAARRVRGGGADAPPTPEGAIDPFHFSHPGVDEIEAWIAAAGLEVVERDRLTKPTYSAFLAAARR
jgi:SAM-dependent methyltransferase